VSFHFQLLPLLEGLHGLTHLRELHEAEGVTPVELHEFHLAPLAEGVTHDGHGVSTPRHVAHEQLAVDTPAMLDVLTFALQVLAAASVGRVGSDLVGVAALAVAAPLGPVFNLVLVSCILVTLHVGLCEVDDPPVEATALLLGRDCILDAQERNKCVVELEGESLWPIFN